MKELKLEEMEKIEGGGRWQDCAYFAAGFIAMFSGPIGGLAGLLTMAASAGDCEAYIYAG